MQAAGLSDIGKVRSQNQDSFFFSTEPVGSLPNLFIVADGMGGHNAGDIASKQAVALFNDHIKHNTDNPANFLDLCISAAQHANRSIYQQACEDPALYGMGTTFSACFILDNQCQIIHIGDSRVYAVMPDSLIQLTQDHSYVHEMVKAGHITPQQAQYHPKRNILTRVMGVDADMEADGYTRSLDGVCAVLLCSDGLHGMISDEEILRIIKTDAAPEERVKALINAANDAGGNDNISVVLIGL